MQLFLLLLLLIVKMFSILNANEEKCRRQRGACFRRSNFASSRLRLQAGVILLCVRPFLRSAHPGHNILERGICLPNEHAPLMTRSWYGPIIDRNDASNSPVLEGSRSFAFVFYPPQPSPVHRRIGAMCAVSRRCLEPPLLSFAPFLGSGFFFDSDAVSRSGRV